MTENDRNPGAPVASPDQVRTIFGDVEDLAVARVVETGASPAEIAEAHAWLNADDQLGRVRHHPPQGRVADVVEIIRAEIEPPEDPGLGGPATLPD